MEIHAVSELQQLVRQSLVDGVLVMEVRLRDERIELLQQIGVPFSMIGRPSTASDMSFADIDFEQTTRDAVAYLVQLGHRQIAFLNHSEELFDAGYGPSVQGGGRVRAGGQGRRPYAHQPLLRRHSACRAGSVRGVRPGASRSYRPSVDE